MVLWHKYRLWNDPGNLLYAPPQLWSCFCNENIQNPLLCPSWTKPCIILNHNMNQEFTPPKDSLSRADLCLTFPSVSLVADALICFREFDLLSVHVRDTGVSLCAAWCTEHDALCFHPFHHKWHFLAVEVCEGCCCGCTLSKPIGLLVFISRFRHYECADISPKLLISIILNVYIIFCFTHVLSKFFFSIWVFFF